MVNDSDNSATAAAEWAHDANNILCHVIGMLDLARRRPDRADLLEAAYQAARRVTGVFQSTLDIVKAEAGKSTEMEAEFCLREELRAIEQMFEWSMKRHKIDFTIECPFHLTTKVRGNSKRLSRVLINLVQNAHKFTAQHRRSGDGAITLRVCQRSVNLSKAYRPLGRDHLG
jgi:signal transduction histidine kinase